MSQQDIPQGAFTVIACQATACRPAADLLVMPALAATIRRCPHGVLVAAGCPLGPILCRAWHHSRPPRPGTVIIVQPCSRSDRRPEGPATTLGPLRTRQDLTTLCRWLERGQLDTSQLPVRMRSFPPSLRHAGLD